jgi:putative endonuclease
LIGVRRTRGPGRKPGPYGLFGEELAAGYLGRRGYRIVERNFRTRRGEIDLIARDGDTLVFVEVKSRRTDAFGGALSSVDRRKRNRLARLAREYLQRRGWADRPCRFDLVTIRGEDGAEPSIELLQNAFGAEEES